MPMQIQRLPSWGLSLHRADFYGWRWALQIGPLLIWIGSATDAD